MHEIFLGSSVFLACVVEFTEALTVILAIGVSREWRSALLGAVASLITLIIIVIAFEPFLWRAYSGSSRSVQNLWLFMGGLLMIFGLQWMRKAILRYIGIMDIHDEDAAFKKVTTAAKKAGKKRNGIDWYGFVACYKAVLLEGFEVIFIVLAFGSNSGSIGLGVEAAIAALVVVTLLGFALNKPLTKIPENTMKYIVSIVLTTFGTYFAGKGIGFQWPRGQDSVIIILVFYLVTSYAMIVFAKANLLKINQKANT
jgi:uncharacterized membrane protein